MIINNGERTNIFQWGCLALLLASIVFIIGTGIWLFTKPPAMPPGPRPTAIIWTATPTSSPTPTPTRTPQPSPTRPASPEEIGIGIRVRVRGTGASGLSIRASASTGAERVDIAFEDEMFLVVSGPTEAEDFTWWFLRDEQNPEREGWAVENYLVTEQ